MRPCWNIWLVSFGFGVPLALAGDCQAFVSHLHSETIELFSRSHLRNQPTRILTLARK